MKCNNLQVQLFMCMYYISSKQDKGGRKGGNTACYNYYIILKVLYS